MTDKKEFYKRMLIDRRVIAQIDFSLREDFGRIEFYSSPLGVIMLAKCETEGELIGVKIYDRTGGRFELQNVFCGDNLVRMEKGVFISITSKLQIEDVIGRSFLIRVGENTFISRARLLPKIKHTVDKDACLVYN
jgi:hypothetical protein